MHRAPPVLDDSGQPVVDTIRDLPASERFFAGGDTTVRGFALDQLGTPATIDKDGFPIGGNALVILNAELRIPVRGGLGAVGFIDAGNVFAKITGDRPRRVSERRRVRHSLPLTGRTDPRGHGLQNEPPGHRARPARRSNGPAHQPGTGVLTWLSHIGGDDDSRWRATAHERRCRCSC